MYRYLYLTLKPLKNSLIMQFNSAKDVEVNLLKVLGLPNGELTKILRTYNSDLSPECKELIERQIAFNKERFDNADFLMHESYRIQKSHDAAWYSSNRDRMGHFSNIGKDGLGRVMLDFASGQKERTDEIVRLRKQVDESKHIIRNYENSIQEFQEIISAKKEELDDINEKIEENTIGLESIDIEMADLQEAADDYRNLIAERTSELNNAKSVLGKYGFNTNTGTADDLYSTLDAKNNIKDQYNNASTDADRQQILSDNGLNDISELIDEINELEETISDLEAGDGLSGLAEAIEDANEHLTETVDQMKDLEDEKTNLLQEQNDLLAKQRALNDEINGLTSQSNKLLENRQRLLENNKESEEKINELVKKRNDIQEKNNTIMSAFGQIGSGIQGIVGGVVDLIKMAVQPMVDINNHAMQFGRTLGLNRQQARAYQSSLLRNNNMILEAYGKTNEQLFKMQESYSDAINSVTLLNAKQMEGLVATSQFMGEDNVKQSIENLDKFGAGVNTATEYLALTNERAKMYGLNAVKSSQAFASNIKMASRYTFKDGINGISRMTMLSQRLRFNMDSLGGVIDKFSTIEDAISTSAQLQVLGGSYAANFSNPLEMMNIALTDGEEMMNRLVQTFRDKGSFDEQTGMVKINSFEKRLMSEAAKIMGVSYEDVFNIANQETKRNKIDSMYGVGSRFADKSQQEWIYNNAQWNADKKSYEINYFDDSGKQRQIDVSDINSKNIDAIRQTSSKEEMMQDDVHAMRMHFLGKTKSRAKGVVSVSERVSGVKDSLTNQLIVETGFEKMFNKFDDLMYNPILKGNTITGQIKDWLNDVLGEKLGDIIYYLAAIAAIGGAGILLSIGKGITSILKGGFKLGRMLISGVTGAFKWGKNAVSGLYKWGKGLFSSSAAKTSAKATEKTVAKATEKTVARAADNVAGKTSSRALTEAETKLTRQIEQKTAALAKANAKGASKSTIRGIENEIKTLTQKLARTSKIADEAAKKALGKATTIAEGKATSQIIKGGLGRTATRAGLKTLGKTGTKLASKALGGAGAAAIVEIPLAMWETYERNKEYEAEKAEINAQYGSFDKNDLTNRMGKGGESFYLEAEKQIALKDAELRKDNDNTATWSSASGAIAGAAAGAAIGSAVPVIGTFIGGLVGGIVGGIGGEMAARASATNVTDEEVFGKDELAQRNFETTKIGLKNIKTKDDLFEQAAIATIGIHDLLVSQDHESHGKKWNGDTEEEFSAKKEKIEKEKKAAYKKENPTVWYNPLTWFAKGGVVHASTGLQSVPSFNRIPSANARGNDIVPAMLTPGEMILNANQQGNLWNIINKNGLFSSPTYIAQNNANNFGNGGYRSGRLSVEPFNINININGSGNLAGLDLQTIQNAILDPNTIKKIHESLDRVSGTMFNGGTNANEHSPHKLRYV